MKKALFTLDIDRQKDVTHASIYKRGTKNPIIGTVFSPKVKDDEIEEWAIKTIRKPETFII